MLSQTLKKNNHRAARTTTTISLGSGRRHENSVSRYRTLRQGQAKCVRTSKHAMMLDVVMTGKAITIYPPDHAPPPHSVDPKGGGFVDSQPPG